MHSPDVTVSISKLLAAVEDMPNGQSQLRATDHKILLRDRIHRATARQYRSSSMVSKSAFRRVRDLCRELRRRGLEPRCARATVSRHNGVQHAGMPEVNRG